ncbi:sulfate/molybdate ABC transporter ATP-binding protein [Acetobacter conturbans]|uniref:ATP-binding cassette domain-containing protein n=1 Tax=Acetobacter conturbans TaxID=1737472 RepID=A0ABX0K565_9PROT|nr:sulfate/molybdate ABC transporter ATP-binding protein [Acetobacter conturbans]NHN88569.1 ATP-binding cassette domain-containing protein [Acetobacter conturbans]
MSVRIEDLVRRAPGNHDRILLDQVTVDIPDGAFVALVGPSGAGKTTLLRAIAGLDPFDTGRIVIDDRNTNDLSARERNVGFVFQNYALFRHMTVAKNISFGLDVLPGSQRPAKSEIDRRVKELLDLIQLPDLGSSYPQRLSGGQRQRVALARALATRPKHLLLDEPFGALDPVVRRTVRQWLRSLHDQLGLTTILVTHDQEEALDVADRLVVMQDGRIVQDDGAEALENRPATPFVMEFLGETLSFPGRITGGMFLPELPHVAPFPVAGIADGPAAALIRPHEIRLTPEAGGAPVQRAGSRYGLSKLAVDLGDRIVDILVPASEAVPASGVKLHIAAARLFRDDRLLEPTHEARVAAA